MSAATNEPTYEQLMTRYAHWLRCAADAAERRGVFSSRSVVMSPEFARALAGMLEYSASHLSVEGTPGTSPEGS